MNNPYRDAFYQRQAEWHSYTDAAAALRRHETRVPYYRWYTEGWLPTNKDARILDIGCAGGQFLHFLKGEGYTDARGIDLDHRQTELAREIGFNVECVDAISYLDAAPGSFDAIAMLDIIEHFRRDELFPLMTAVTAALKPGGVLLASVPNAESPTGLPCYFADITHEMAYTLGSFKEMLFCHGLELAAWRDPWPAPVNLSRKVYRAVAQTARKAAAFKYRLMGLEPPKVWSNVFWALAKKTRG